MKQRVRHRAQRGSRNYKNGLWAEALSELALRLKGYRVLARRFRSARGEVDLIVHKSRTIVMVEVKARASMDSAAAAISPHQQHRLQGAALDFIARHPHLAHCDCRFDAMLVAPNRWPQHIINAWMTE